MNETLSKFRFPENLIKEYKYWYLLLRPEQTTLGAMVLVTKFNESKYSDLSLDAFTELSIAIKDIESFVDKSFLSEKINYLMLMMNEPEVHYHVIPRYSKEVFFDEKIFLDGGWPGIPALGEFNKTGNKTFRKILELAKKNI